jgi:serine/threonine-protein kinase
VRQFQIQRLIGTGASGRVYVARDTELDRLVALKLLHPQEESARVLREASLQARLDHPSIARVYETGTFDGRPAIAMQLVDGPPLTEVAQELSLREKLRIVEKIARAVHAAHQEGLVHRDLKPSNLLLQATADGWHPVVVDFGLAIESEAPALTATDTVVGTPEYMAPEQLRGERGRTVDVYALGVILYELLSGQRPHRANSRVALVLEILGQPAPSLRRVIDVDRDLAAVVDHALEHAPEDRYGSAERLADDLAAVLDGRPVKAVPQTAWYRARKWIGRHRALAAVTGAVAAVILLLLAGLGFERWRGTQRTQLAQQFAQISGDASWRMRVVEMAPLHDTTQERSQLDRSRSILEELMHDLGRAARGPGHEALGALQLTLDRPAAAREHFETALAAGFATPQ